MIFVDNSFRFWWIHYWKSPKWKAPLRPPYNSLQANKRHCVTSVSSSNIDVKAYRLPMRFPCIVEQQEIAE